MKEEPLYIYVDVDDTLIRKTAEGETEPRSEVVEHIKYLAGRGALLYCWSTGGEAHARRVAQELGLDGAFRGYLHKPHLFIDDQEPAQWENFLHVRPDHLGTIEEYRSELKNPEVWKVNRAGALPLTGDL